MHKIFLRYAPAPGTRGKELDIEKARGVYSTCNIFKYDMGCTRYKYRLGNHLYCRYVRSGVMLAVSVGTRPSRGRGGYKRG